MFSTKFAALILILALSSSLANCQTQTAAGAPLQEAVSGLPASNLLAASSYELSSPVPTLFVLSSLVPDSLNSKPHSLSKPDQLGEDQKPPPDDPKPGSKKNGRNKDKLKVHPFSTVALGIKAGTLGAGAEIATPLSRTLNLRASVNYMAFRYSFNVDGIHYYTRADFRSGQLGIDWFPFRGGFHISPGYMYFNQSVAGAAKVPPGQSFKLDHYSYINSVDDPVGGNASITYDRRYAPFLTVGFTNIIPRNGKHFSVPFEIGAAYTHAPIMAVQLAGTACTVQGCFNAATDPDTQSNLKQEVNDLNETVQKATFYPIVSLGFAVRF